MTRLTMGEAARAGWGSRASLYRLAKAGKLSTTVDGDRQLVDVAELVRVLGEPRAQRKREAVALVEAPDRNARAELERRVAELETAKAAVEAELRAERTAARDAAAAAAADRAKLIELAELAQRQAGEAQKLLTDARATAARPWWRKLLGRPAVLGVAVALLLAGGEARGQAMRTGNDFLPYCGDQPLVDPDPKQVRAAFFIRGNCLGVVSTLLFASAGGLLRPEHRFCPPAGGTSSQARQVVVAFMKRYPAMLHLDFEVLALEALRKAWPCR
jgi:hypothetical protein